MSAHTQYFTCHLVRHRKETASNDQDAVSAHRMSRTDIHKWLYVTCVFVIHSSFGGNQNELCLLFHLLFRGKLAERADSVASSWEENLPTCRTTPDAWQMREMYFPRHEKLTWSKPSLLASGEIAKCKVRQSWWIKVTIYLQLQRPDLNPNAMLRRFPLTGKFSFQLGGKLIWLQKVGFFLLIKQELTCLSRSWDVWRQVVNQWRCLLILLVTEEFNVYVIRCQKNGLNPPNWEICCCSLLQKSL